MTTMPERGQQLPDVEFITEGGERLAAGDLAGKKTVLYFYPRDDTPGCTKEACAFRDRMEDYGRASIRVYGVSLDSPESHRRFSEKYDLNFPLLTDEGGRAKRVTFLLDNDGKVARVYPEVSPETHADEILNDAESL